MELYYKSSEGEVLNLIGNEYKMLSETDLFNTEWQYETVGTNYPYITAFKNQMVSKSFTLMVSGSTNDDLKDNLEHLMEVTDRDVRIGQMGRIYYGNYYRECYCTATEKGKVEGQTKTSVVLTVVAEDGDWKSIQNQSYSGLSGGKYINKYCVPSVSSNENDYEYGIIEDTQGTFTFTADFSQGFDVSHYTEFTFDSVSANVQYRFTPVGTYTTVTPSDCPLEIDVSNKEQIEIKPSTFCTISYSMTATPNASYINWSSAPNDEVREFVLDLGDVTSVESVTGLEVVNLEGTVETHNASMMLSRDNINWVTADTATMTGESAYPLELTTQTDFRYIKITSDGIFKVQSRAFIIEAHFTSEEQNLATSVVVSSSALRDYTYEITEQGLVEMSVSFSSVGYPSQMIFALPNTTTIVAINNLTIKNNEGVTRTLEIIGDNRTLDTITLSANSTTNYSWGGEEEVSVVKLQLQCRDVEITSSNFEILEEQTEAPHRYILNENYVPSDAIIKIYGATSTPSIIIGGNQYGAYNITVDNDEWLEINTKDETIEIKDGEGTENVFYHRLDNSFEKIPVGSSEITWEGNLSIDIELLNSRSDPKWN